MQNVIIADSNRIERRFLENFFKTNMHAYHLAGAVESRQQLLVCASQTEPDILLLDTEFDRGSWQPIAVSLRRLYPRLAIILNSLYPDFSTAQKAIGLGICGFLLKPADEKSLTEALNNIETFSYKHAPPVVLPTQHDAYPFGAELRLLKALTQKDHDLFLEESTQYLLALQTEFRGQDFQFYVCHLILSIRWALEHYSIAPVRLAALDIDLHIRNIMTAPNFQAMKDGIRHYFDVIARLILPVKEIQTNCSELVVNYVKGNFQTKITLEDLANRFHFSAAHIARCLKRDIGKTLNEYVNELRVAKATELLTQTTLPVAAVAHASGFINVSHFDRVFRDRTSLTPTEMRQNHSEM